MNINSIETSPLLKSYDMRLSEKFIGTQPIKYFLDDLVQKICIEVWKNSVTYYSTPQSKPFTEHYNIHMGHDPSMPTIISRKFTEKVFRFWKSEGNGGEIEEKTEEYYKFRCTCYHVITSYFVNELKKMSAREPYHSFQYNIEINYSGNLYSKKFKNIALASGIFMASTLVLAPLGAVLIGDRHQGDAKIIVKTELKKLPPLNRD